VAEKKKQPIKLNPNGLLRDVVKRQKERDKAMKELFGEHQPPNAGK